MGRGNGQEARPVIEPSGRGCNPEPPALAGTLTLQGGGGGHISRLAFIRLGAFDCKAI